MDDHLQTPKLSDSAKPKSKNDAQTPDTRKPGRISTDERDIHWVEIG